MFARPEQIAVLPEVDELDILRLAHDQLGAPLDFLVLVRKTVGERVARIIGPFDDVDELTADEIRQRHGYLARIEHTF